MGFSADRKGSGTAPPAQAAAAQRTLSFPYAKWDTALLSPLSRIVSKNNKTKFSVTRKLVLLFFSKPVRQMPESFFSKLSYEHR